MSALYTEAGVVLNNSDSGAGSLRDAILSASSGEVITFDASLDGATIVLSGGLPVLTSLDIDASSLPNGIYLDGNNAVQVFYFGPDITSRLTGFTVQNAKSQWGGGINNSGNLTLNEMTLRDNEATSVGGAIRHFDGSLTLNNSTVYGNTAQEGGGIHIENNTSGEDEVTLNQSTISGNVSTGSGGGIYQNTGTTLILNGSTIVSNTAGTSGGGVSSLDGELHCTNTIISGNSAASNQNLHGSAVTSINCLIVSDPKLNVLGAYGGRTWTMPPVPGSPAVDGGSTADALSQIDQRGLDRLVGSSVDIGAAEASFLFQVTTTADSGAGSLRELIGSVVSGTVITFAPSLSNQVIRLTSGEILINKSLRIIGPGADVLTVSGENRSRIFSITYVSCEISDLSMVSGKAPDVPFSYGGYSLSGSGGAIYNEGILTLNRCQLSSNNAGNGADADRDSEGCGNGGFGGALYTTGATTLNACTFSSNRAGAGGDYTDYEQPVGHIGSTGDGGSGGAIYKEYGRLTINDSTFYSNSTGLKGDVRYSRIYISDGEDGIGGALLTDASSTLTNCTVSGNSSGSTYYGDGGGGIHATGSITLINSIVAENSSTSSPNIDGTLSADSVNNIIGGSPQLLPLGNYGGPTQTMPPQLGSPAIDAGLNSAVTSSTDQRGLPRILQGYRGEDIVDIGAVEFSGWLLGEDLSALDPDVLNSLSGAIYDSTTQFPDGADPEASGLLEILSASDKLALVNAGSAAVTSDPEAYGLYTESALQALALGQPVLTADPTSGKFTLRIGVLQTPNLSSAFTPLYGFTVTPHPSTGEIEIEFDAPTGDAHFFRLFGDTM